MLNSSSIPTVLQLTGRRHKPEYFSRFYKKWLLISKIATWQFKEVAKEKKEGNHLTENGENEERKKKDWKKREGT